MARLSVHLQQRRDPRWAAVSFVRPFHGERAANSAAAAPFLGKSPTSDPACSTVLFRATVGNTPAALPIFPVDQTAGGETPRRESASPVEKLARRSFISPMERVRRTLPYVYA